MTSGGSPNTQQYYKNPVYAFKLAAPTDMQVRLQVIQEEPHPGAIITDPHSFAYSANLAIYKMNYIYPPAPGSMKLGPAMVEILQTYNGTYTSSPQLLVTEQVFFILDYIETCATWDVCNDSGHLQSDAAWSLPHHRVRFSVF